MPSARIPITSRNFSYVASEIFNAYLITFRDEGPAWSGPGMEASFEGDDDVIHAELKGSGING